MSELLIAYVLLSLNYEAVQITLHWLILWRGEGLLPSTKYDVNLNHANIFSLVKRKNAVRKSAKLGAVPTSAGTSTFVTAKSNNCSN